MATAPPGKGRGGRRAIACSYAGAAQATGFGLGTFDEEQTFLDARNGEQPRLEIRVDRPSTSKIAGVVVRIRVEATYVHEVGRRVIVDAEYLEARAVVRFVEALWTAMDNDAASVIHDLPRSVGRLNSSSLNLCDRH